jgi:prepilin-type processing-associated H-X9-DG protein
MASLTDDHRDRIAPIGANPPPVQFGLRTIFVVTAIAAVLGAGASAGGETGFFAAMFAVSAGVTVWGLLNRPNRLVEFGCLGCVASMVFLLLAPVGMDEHARNRVSCPNYMKQLGLALLNFADKHQTLPPAVVFDSRGLPMHSWRTLILPEIEEGTLYATYHFDEPWNGPRNRTVTQVEVRDFQCPEDKPKPFETSYVAIIGPGTAWSVPGGAKLSDITDGPENTILLVEMKNSGIKWAEPRDLDLNNLPPGLTKQNLLHSLSNHAGGFNAVFADAHVEFIPETIPWTDFEALLTIAGGEKVDRSRW